MVSLNSVLNWWHAADAVHISSITKIASNTKIYTNRFDVTNVKFVGSEEKGESMFRIICPKNV